MVRLEMMGPIDLAECVAYWTRPNGHNDNFTEPEQEQGVMRVRIGLLSGLSLPLHIADKSGDDFGTERPT